MEGQVLRIPQGDWRYTVTGKISLAAMAFLFTAGPALADPIDGNWRTVNGQTAAISGGVITLRTGKYAGKRIGFLKATGGGRYSGTITDPFSDKSYSGTAMLSGSSLRMSGCVMKVICMSQTWKKMETQPDAVGE